MSASKRTPVHESAADGEFANRLLEWFDRYGRKSLPWQVDRDPYRVWISEIMLQQTQVNAVIPYFIRFVERFPDIASLAGSDSDEVMHYWSGLGYYARARNLHKAAQFIYQHHNGRFPASLESVMALPGVGRSTAGAILSFCFGQRHPILDGNVKRVLTRFFAIPGYPGFRQVENRLWQLADQLTPASRIEDYTQAIMDLGATVCFRRQPDCQVCPMQDGCAALRQGTQSHYPTPKPKKTRPTHSAIMLILIDSRRRVVLEKRPPSGIWGGLWSLPELPDTADVEEFAKNQFGLRTMDIRDLDPLQHGFTHFDLRIIPRICSVEPGDDRIMDAERYLWYNMSDPQSVGLPAAISRILASLSL